MSDGLHLLPRHRAKIEALLREHLPDVEVWAYGSRVTGESHDGSDLDLVLRGRELKEINIGRLGDFTEAVEMSTIPFIVEARDWARIPQSFHESILDNYVVLTPGDGRISKVMDNRIIWHHVLLGKLVNNFDSRRVPLSRRERSTRPGPYPYYGATGVMDYIDDYLFEGLHLLVGEDGSVETPTGAPYAQLVDGRFWVNNHAHVLQGSDDDETRFLYYALSATQIRPFVSGSVQPKLTQANLNRVPVPYPKHASDRRAIANVLGTLDARIELNRRISQTLEGMSRALFRSWFVDFDPVRAKAEGRPSDLPPDLDALFPDFFEQSELGDIPTGWPVVSLSDFIDAVKGLSYKGLGLSVAGIPLHNLNSIHEGGGYKPDGMKFYTGDYRPRHLVEPGDVIVANTEQGHERLLIGFAAIVPTSYGSEGLFTHHLYRVRARNGVGITSDYICHLLNSHPMQTVTSGYATGTTVNMLPVDALELPQAVLPPTSLVETFSSISASLRTRRDGLHTRSHALARLRDTLLPKLLSGELRVLTATA